MKLITSSFIFLLMSCSCSYFPYIQNHKMGFINTKGKKIIAPEYSAGLPNVLGYNAIIVKKNQYWGAINKDNKIIIPFHYNALQNPSDGLLACRENQLFGFINLHNQVVIPFQYQQVWQFHEGVAVVAKKKQLQIINKKGQVLFSSLSIPHKKIQLAHQFSQGLIPIAIDGKWGYMNHQWKILITPEYKRAFPFSEGLALVEDQKGHKFFINHKGQKSLGAKNGEFVSSFSDGLALVRQGKQYGYINKKGSIVLPIQYYNAHNFHEGLAAVSIGEHSRLGFINKQGHFVITPVFDVLPISIRFQNSLTLLCYGNEFFYYNRQGKMVFHFKIQV